jgi:deoxycytidine triphosphate deaminase
MELPDSYKLPKPNVKEEDFWLDPDQGSTPGLLLSDRIKFYRDKVNLIYPFDEKSLEPASYTLHAGGEYLIHDEMGKRISGVLKPDEKVIIPPNGLIYIRFLEEVNIPHYMIARFNLRVKQVYRGLLLGTGPQVDPGFRGHLGCPLHNFTNEEKAIEFFEKLVTIDFEKTTPLGQVSFAGKKSGDFGAQDFGQMHHGLVAVGGINSHPCKIYNKEQDRPLKDYLPSGESVQSSVFELQTEVKQLRGDVREFGNTIQRYKTFAIWSLIGVALTVIGGLVTLNIVLYQSMESKYINLETNFFSGYVNLKDNYQSVKDNISEMSKALGHLEALKEKTASSDQSKQQSKKSVEKKPESVNEPGR